MSQTRALDLIRRHGWNATAFQTLQSGYVFHFEDDACVAYADVGSAWVAAGAPIAAADALQDVTRRFVEAARARGKRCCFFAVEERFLAHARDMRAVPIGELPVWDPRGWTTQLAGTTSLRAQLRRAAKKGVVARAVASAELTPGAALRVELDSLTARWLASRRMPAMGFLVRVEPFTLLDERRCFAAERDGEVCAFAAITPVPARHGWLIENLIRAPHAPNGTTELLVDAIMRWADDAGSRWLTLGLSPLAGNVPPVLRVARRTMSALYDFNGLRSFRSKLRPDHWRPIYLGFPQLQGTTRTFIDALRAFADGDLFSFAARSLVLAAGRMGGLHRGRDANW